MVLSLQRCLFESRHVTCSFSRQAPTGQGSESPLALRRPTSYTATEPSLSLHPSRNLIASQGSFSSDWLTSAELLRRQPYSNYQLESLNMGGCCQECAIFEVLAFQLSELRRRKDVEMFQVSADGIAESAFSNVLLDVRSQGKSLLAKRAE